MTRIYTWIALAMVSATTLCLTLVILMRDAIPRWEGWAAITVVLLTVSLMAYLSGRRSILDGELRAIDEEYRREMTG